MPTRMPTFSLHPSRTGTQTSAHEMAPPRPPRVENTLNKTLTRYMTTDEEVEEFLRRRFDSYPEYKFDLTIRTDRWHFYAPEDVPVVEWRKHVTELQKRKDQEAREEKEREAAQAAA